MLTIDASVWVNADSPQETDSASSRAFLDKIAAHVVIVVPTLLRVEIAAAVSRKRKNAAMAREFSEKIAALPHIHWVPLDAALADQAATLAADHGLRGADATYAAVAMIHQCTLVSLDREHLTRLRSILNVRTPAEMLSTC